MYNWRKDVGVDEEGQSGELTSAGGIAKFVERYSASGDCYTRGGIGLVSDERLTMRRGLGWIR